MYCKMLCCCEHSVGLLEIVSARFPLKVDLVCGTKPPPSHFDTHFSQQRVYYFVDNTIHSDNFLVMFKNTIQ